MKLYNTPGLSQIYFRRSPSPPYLKKSSYESTGFFFVYCTHRGDEKPRPGVDNWRQPVGQTVNAASGLPAGRGEIVHINCLVAQSTIKMRKRVQNIYVLSGHFLSLPHLLKCPQRKYMSHAIIGNESNLLIVFYVQIMPDDFVMQLHRF